MSMTKNDEKEVIILRETLEHTARSIRSAKKEKAEIDTEWRDTFKEFDLKMNKVLQEIDQLTDPEKFPLFKKGDEGK